MSSPPRIAVPVPTSSDHSYNQRCWPDYAAAISHCGAQPVMVPLGLSSSEVRLLAKSCQGVLLPGSPADVDPHRYAQEPVAECAPADRGREAVDLILLEEAFHARKPLLGICFGMQILNVWRGGTLLQDLAPLPVNHSAGASVAVAHTATVSSSSMLGEVAGSGMGACSVDATGAPESFVRVSVNSSHHQAVGIPGEGLSVVGCCAQDGVVEALEGGSQDHFVLGVQWHPERGFAQNDLSQRIMRRFVQAAAGLPYRSEAVAGLAE